MDRYMDLIERVKACRVCAEARSLMPNQPNPVFQFRPSARILIAGQAPGNLADQTRIPFNDPSGQRLRTWLGVSGDEFYNPEMFAILPMGFCFPGYDRHGGDLPPRKECAATWRVQLLGQLNDLRTIILIGGYAQSWHLQDQYKGNVTRTVEAWQQFAPKYFPVPHPSWRNNAWLKRHPWFETDLLPALQKSVQSALRG